ncbi:MAG: hypothetical protein PUB21_08220 [Bacteroidales bacterium]|nr:hypothetical protein [Bacteroidales bacterium]
MNKTIHYFVFAVLLAIASSCIKSDLPECPPQFTVQVLVKDRNYFNIDDFPQLTKADDNLPFGYFIKTLYYTLRNRATNKVIRYSALIQTDKDESDIYTLTFNDIPEGEYELIVWGNLETITNIGSLHPDNKEYADIYAASATLNFTRGYKKAEVLMQRVKGKLLLLYKNFPAEYTSIKQSIDNITQSVDTRFKYDGVTRVEKDIPVQNSDEIRLAPTTEGSLSKLQIVFNSGVSTLALPDINITVNRNEITAVSVDYNAIEGIWEIQAYINGEWTTIHRLDID